MGCVGLMGLVGYPFRPFDPFSPSKIHPVRVSYPACAQGEAGARGVGVERAGEQRDGVALQGDVLHRAGGIHRAVGAERLHRHRHRLLVGVEEEVAGRAGGVAHGGADSNGVAQAVAAGGQAGLRVDALGAGAEGHAHRVDAADARVGRVDDELAHHAAELGAQGERVGAGDVDGLRRHEGLAAAVGGVGGLGGAADGHRHLAAVAQHDHGVAAQVKAQLELAEGGVCRVVGPQLRGAVGLVAVGVEERQRHGLHAGVRGRGVLGLRELLLADSEIVNRDRHLGAERRFARILLVAPDEEYHHHKSYHDGYWEQHPLRHTRQQVCQPFHFGVVLLVFVVLFHDGFKLKIVKRY